MLTYKIIIVLYTPCLPTLSFTMRGKVAATALKCNNNVIAHIIQYEKDNMKREFFLRIYFRRYWQEDKKWNKMAKGRVFQAGYSC